MREVVIVDGVRSPIGKYGGALCTVRPDDLLAEVYKGLMKRTGVETYGLALGKIALQIFRQTTGCLYLKRKRTL